MYPSIFVFAVVYFRYFDVFVFGALIEQNYCERFPVVDTWFGTNADSILYFTVHSHDVLIIEVRHVFSLDLSVFISG